MRKKISPWFGIFLKYEEMQRLKIELLLQTGQNKKALRRAQAILSNKASGTISYQAGVASRALGLYDEAMRHFKDAFDSQYKEARSADAIAACYKICGTIQDDLLNFQASSLAFPRTFYERRIWLEELSQNLSPEISYHVMKGVVPKDAHIQYVDAHLFRHIQDIRALSFSNAWAEVRMQCEKILSRFKSPQILGLMGYMYFQTGEYQKAVEYCEAANHAGLKDPYNLYFLGVSLCELGLYEDALAMLDSVNCLAPTFFDVVTPMTRCFVYLFEPTSALEKFTALKARFPFVEHVESLKCIGFQFFGALVELPKSFVCAKQTTGLDWIKENNGDAIWQEQSHDIPVKTPFVIARSYDPVETNVTSNAAYIGELKSALVFSKSNIVLTSDNFAIDDIGADPRFGTFVSHEGDQAVLAQYKQSLLINPSAFQIKDIEIGIMLSGAASGEFGHWVPEFLPKLQYCEHHPDFGRIPLIIDEDMPQSHFDYLDCVAPDHPRITLKAGSALKCQTLLYAPPTTFFPMHLHAHSLSPFEIGPVSPQSYMFLKRKIEERFGTPTPKGRKIYLTRCDMSWSKLSNEAVVTEALRNRGFEIVKIENLTFKDQVELFQQAAIVVAAGGSALQNIIFSHPSTRLIVMTQENLHNWGCFNGQVGALGYEIVFVCGAAKGDARNKHSDYEIPLDDLNAALDYTYA